MVKEILIHQKAAKEKHVLADSLGSLKLNLFYVGDVSGSVFPAIAAQHSLDTWEAAERRWCKQPGGILQPGSVVRRIWGMGGGLQQGDMKANLRCEPDTPYACRLLRMNMPQETFMLLLPKQKNLRTDLVAFQKVWPLLLSFAWFA